MRSFTLALLLLAGPALAAPLSAKNGRSVNVSLRGKRERGIGLKAQSAGWRLELRNGAEETAEVIDVTQGVTPSKWLVPVEDGALVFDAPRFVAGHAYRVELKRAGSALIYLYPPPVGKRTSKIEFVADESPLDDGGIAITPKSAL